MATAMIDASAGEQQRKKPFYTSLFLWFLVAVVAGGLVSYYFKGAPWIDAYLKPLDDGFVKLVKMIIAPVIFLTISIGIGGMRNMEKLDRVALKALTYFLFFSTLALIIGLIVANFLQPG